MIKRVNICTCVSVEGKWKPSKVTLEVTLVGVEPEERARTGGMVVTGNI